MFNEKLSRDVSVDDLIKMGFTIKDDEDKDPRGRFYEIKNDNFHLFIDAWFEVQLRRVNPDTDPIILFVQTKFDLQCVVDWIED